MKLRLFSGTALLLLLAMPGFSAILPDTIGAFQRGDAAPAPAPDAKVWNEFGLQASETSPYADPATGKKFSITAYRFQDSTGALAAWMDARPADAKPFQGDGIGVETATEQYIAVGNFLFIFHGYKPNHDELAHVFLTVPLYTNAPLGPLRGYVPHGFIPNSERYILGPESLAKYAGLIPPSTAAFHFSTEGEAVDFAPSTTKAGAKSGAKTTLVIFNFPGIEMAQKQFPAFAAVPGTVAKRTGPIVAIALHPVTPDDAERVLSQVKYQAEITMNERPPTLKDNPGNLLLNIAILCGVLIVFCVISGLVFGGIRYALKRSGAVSEADEMISLHLTEKS